MMSRRVAIAALVLLWTSAAVADAPASRPIDLNASGVLEALEQSNPAHHEKIRRILTGIVRTRDAEVPRWMQANFAAHDVSYAPVVLTSDPPKRRLSFSLDAVRYQAVVTLTNVRGEIVPLK